MEIARRFNAGFQRRDRISPEGTADVRVKFEDLVYATESAVPSGLWFHWGSFPALKRRAISNRP